jgi:uncharacterized membrane protein YeaQ/YmgE (transglycosylase-associated protein family)
MGLKIDGDWIIPVLVLKQTLAGGTGGLVRWLLTGGTHRNLFGAIFVGMACGRYLAPIMGSMTGVTTNSELADAFIAGICGALLTQWLLNIVERNVPTKATKETEKSIYDDQRRAEDRRPSDDSE